MKNGRARFFLVLVLVAAAHAGDLRQGLADSVSRLEARLGDPDPQPSIRDLPNAALAKLALGGDPRGAERLLRFCFQQQNMDPNSGTYGEVPWQVGHPEISDKNAIEFTMQAVGPILLQYGDKLSEPFKQELLGHVHAAFAAMRRHKVPVSYTNIFLMKTVNMILSGEAAGDAQAAADGYAQLDEWIDYTRRAGIHEFDSPTYYATDLNSLVLAYRYAARPEARAKFKSILDYFWKDIAANYFPGRQNLSGPHSRDYDFLTGHGGLEFYLQTAGLRQTPPPQSVDLEKIAVLINESKGGYHPDPAILALAKIPERVVLQTFELQPGTDRYNYITPDFSIGSSSANYNAQDKPIKIELAAPKELPEITVVPDIFDNPYGKLKVKDRSGHNKPHHVPLSPTAVQEKGTLLVLLDLDPAKEKDIASFATNVILPAKADLLVIDGAPVSVRHPVEEAAAVGSVLGVREGSAAVAIRVFHADACGGQKPLLALKADREGLKYDAARYVVYHYRGASQILPERHIRIGLLFLAARCASAAEFSTLLARAKAARIEESADAHTWTVKARAGDTTLEASRNLDKRQILYRRVNGQDVKFLPLAVNGEAIRLE